MNQAENDKLPRVWYKDRDFPEIKGGVMGCSAEIIAVVPDLKQLQVLVEEHNDAVLQLAEANFDLTKSRDELAKLQRENERLKADIREAATTIGVYRKELGMCHLGYRKNEPCISANCDAINHR
jgi:hypothetical protein